MVNIQADKSVVIVGLADGDTDGIKEKFKSFLEENAIKVASIPLNPCQAKFVLDYCEKFNAENPKRKALKTLTQLRNPAGTLRLEGTDKSIQEGTYFAQELVIDLIKMWWPATIFFYRP